MNSTRATPSLPGGVASSFWTDLDDALTPHTLTQKFQETMATNLTRYARLRELPDSVAFERGDGRVVYFHHRPELQQAYRDLVSRLSAVAEAGEQFKAALERLDEIGTGLPPKVVCYCHDERVHVDAILARCERELRGYRSLLRHRKGPRVDLRRQVLIGDVISLMRASQLPLERSDDGTLARVLRVVLGATDNIDGVPVKTRKYMKTDIAKWLDSAPPEHDGQTIWQHLEKP